MLPRNLEERKSQITIISKDNISDPKDIVVCEKHWPNDYPTITDFCKLCPRNPHSVFDSIKSRLLPIVPSTQEIC